MATATTRNLMPSMRHSFSGRVRNFNLPPTAANCMMPVYEAVTNALYAIQERFPDTWADDGIVTIEVLRERPSGNDREQPEHQQVSGFVVTDNGIGLRDDLFGHFCELDTEYRAEKKGRGIGRLSWIKVFTGAEVVSIFDRDTSQVERSFTFKLSNERPSMPTRKRSNPTRLRVGQSSGSGSSATYTEPRLI
jgi:hypothetical protein